MSNTRTSQIAVLFNAYMGAQVHGRLIKAGMTECVHPVRNCSVTVAPAEIVLKCIATVETGALISNRVTSFKKQYIRRIAMNET